MNFIIHNPGIIASEASLISHFLAIHLPLVAYESHKAVYSLFKLFRTPPACLVFGLFSSNWDFPLWYVIAHSIGNSGHLIILFLLSIVIILKHIDFINYQQVSITPLPSNPVGFFSWIRLLLYSKGSGDK